MDSLSVDSLKAMIAEIVNEAPPASADASEAFLLELLKLLTPIFWIIFWTIIVRVFYRTIIDHLLPRLSALKAFGLEVSFLKSSLKSAVETGEERGILAKSVELAEKDKKWQVHVTAQNVEDAVNRMKNNLALFEGIKILWIDDVPENNMNERKMFRQLKTEIEFALDTEEALRLLRRKDFDLILSDISRNNNNKAGLEFLKEYEDAPMEKRPVIFYVGVFDPALGTPGGAFGITNRPDELVHYVMDVLERGKG